MKIIQSFWTKPFLRSSNSLIDARLNGGWTSRKYNYFSWALSCLQLLKYYKEVELVTDDLGRFLLIDQMQLPYTGVSVGLNDLDDQEPGLWALGKIYAYQLQDGPFLHVDNDIFIWKEFADRITNAPLSAQNRESNSSLYAETFREVCEKFTYLPSFLRSQNGAPSLSCSNVGIVGGNAVGFFKEYTAEAFKFVEENANAIRKNIGSMNTAYLNIIYEQLFFLHLAAERAIPVTYLFPEHDNIPRHLGLFHKAEQNDQFVHCLGTYKQNRIVYEILELKLKSLYPDYYYRILDLLANAEL